MFYKNLIFMPYKRAIPTLERGNTNAKSKTWKAGL